MQVLLLMVINDLEISNNSSFIGGSHIVNLVVVFGFLPEKNWSPGFYFNIVKVSQLAPQMSAGARKMCKKFKQV